MTPAAPAHHSDSRAAWLIFAAAFAAAASFWLILPAGVRTTRSTDFITAYEPIARNILAGNGVTTGDGELATHYPPGYSLILAAIFQAANLLHVPQNVLLQLLAFAAHALTAVLIFQIAASIWSRHFALIPSLLWITYPPALWFTAVLNSEVAFTPIFYAVLLLLWRQLRRPQLSFPVCFLAGFLMGAAMLVRPIAIAGALLLATLLWAYQPTLSRNRRATAIAVLILGNLLAILPWQAYVYNKIGKIVLLSTGGLPSMIDGLTFALPDPTRPDVHVSPDVASLMRQTHDAYVTRQINSVSGAFAWLADQAQTSPLAVLKLFALKVARSWYGTDSHRYEHILLALQIPYLLAGAIGIILALRWHGPARQMASISLLFTFYFWAMTVLVLSLLRYLVPAMPLLFLLMPGLWVFVRFPSRRKLPSQAATRAVD